jgi:riboflavin synthase
MFTGIIKSLGTIQESNKSDSKLELWVGVQTDIWNRTNIGDSIAVNGVCLTVVKKEDKSPAGFSFIFDVVDETLGKTNLGSMGFHEIVNIEAPLKISDGLDGHIVQGHIDTTGQIISNQLIDDDWLLEVKMDRKWLKYCINKGSIAVDGISLTIAKINDNYDDRCGSVSMSIIPHTLEHTNLKFKTKDDTVNIETDFFGKYIEKFLKPRMDINE